MPHVKNSTSFQPGNKHGRPEHRLNVATIAALKEWLCAIGFERSVFVLIRENECNVAFLRVSVEDAVANIEATWLHALRQEKLVRTMAHARIMERLAQVDALPVQR